MIRPGRIPARASLSEGHMAADGEGDVIMTDPANAAAAKEAAASDEPADAPAEDAAAEPAKPEGPTPAEQIADAEAAKEAGNGLLKAGNHAGALEKYGEGIALLEPLLEKKDIEEELLQRRTAAYTALRGNSAAACLKLSDWMGTIEHADKVLDIDKDNAKALYRRGSASIQIDTEGRQEQARADFARVAQLDPSNREAREQLAKAKERLRELRQAEKQRLAQAMTGGLYQEHHQKHDKLQAAYAAEMERRKEAGEDEITLEEYVKKQKEKDEEATKKQKEEIEKRKEEELKARQQAAFDEEAKRRKEAGEEDITFEAFVEFERQRSEEARRARIGGVVQATEEELDEDERKMVGEIKSKGYYHGRLNTVPSNAAPTPQQVEVSKDASPSNTIGSEWNQAGTWEEKEVTEWAKERMTACLADAALGGHQVTLASGDASSVSARVSKVKSLTGDAHIVTVRKKRKCGYNFEAELSFRLYFEGEKEGEEKHSFNGSFKLPELMDAVQPEDLKVEIRWKGTQPPQSLQPTADDTVLKLADEVRSQVARFRTEYEQKP